MPHEVAAPKKVPNQKGKPLGFGKWAWIAAIGIGLIIGIFLYKKSNNSSGAATSDNSSGANSTPLGNQDTGTGGGVVASPPPDLSQLLAQMSALGLIHGGTSDPGAVSQSSGDTSTGVSTDTFVNTDAPTPDTVQPTAAAPIPYTQVGQTYYESSTPTPASIPTGFSGYDIFLQPTAPSNPSTPAAGTQLPTAVSTGDVRKPGFQPDV